MDADGLSTPGFIALVGPTASGKSGISLALADRLRQQGQAVEIVSVDSALVFRGMDIGTAKPTAAERAAVPHHLIDIRDPLHAYSAAEFVRDARQLIDVIHARGALPLLVGGTMLYLNALLHGMDDLPPADPLLRAQLAERGRTEGWAALHAELARVDPATAARLPPADSQRIQRALEVWHTTGRPMSELLTIKNRANFSTPKGALTQNPVVLSLEPTQRAWVHERIAQRFEAMLANGFLDEVRALRARGDLHPDLPSMRCVGYRQAWTALDAGLDVSLDAGRDEGRVACGDAGGEAPTRFAPHDTPQSASHARAGAHPRSARHSLMTALRDTGIAATRQLAKRQITWLRSMPQRTVIACDQGDPLAEVAQHVERALNAMRKSHRTQP